MSVYVDDAFIPYGRMKMCHMMADTETELHHMADFCRIAGKHFQDGKRPHYDLCIRKRSEAINMGAIPITSREMVKRFPKQPKV